VRRRVDLISLTAGVGVAALGLLLLLDQAGALHVTFAAVVPLVCAVLGAILLVSGLTGRN
jgi:hypothetical protein